jgi:hypothetical protein
MTRFSNQGLTPKRGSLISVTRKFMIAGACNDSPSQ